MTEDEDKDFMILALDTLSTLIEKLPKVSPAVLHAYNIVPLLPLVANVIYNFYEFEFIRMNVPVLSKVYTL